MLFRSNHSPQVITTVLTHKRTINAALGVLSSACQQKQSANVLYILMTNRVVPLVNLLERSLSGDEIYHCNLFTLLTLHLWRSDDDNVIQMKGDVIR